MIILRYLSKEIFANLIAITLVLLIIFITNQFVHYLKDAASGQITMTAVMQIMSLQVPLLLGYLLPLGLYLSILLVFGRLYVDHEMTVLSACGVSRAQLFGMSLLIGSIVAIVVAILMIWVEPIVQRYRTKVLDIAVTNASIQKVVPHRFQVAPGAVYYVGKVSRHDRAMYNVFFAKQENKPGQSAPLWDVTIAKSAKEASFADMPGRFVVFENGARYIGTPGKKNYQWMTFEQYGLRLAASRWHLNDWPFTANTAELWHERHNPRAAAMLQWRLAMPISVFLFVLLAVPLSEIRPRQGKFAKFVPAILIYIGYADLMFMGRAWIEKGVISSTIGLWWIHGLALVIALLIILQKIGMRRCK